MNEQNMDKPGKGAGRNDRQLQGETGTADAAAPQSKVVRPGSGDPQTRADGSPANGGIDPKRGF
ncbi:MAG: hypothetical protein V4574_07975 [Pseudomonadota bacterium]